MTANLQQVARWNRSPLGQVALKHLESLQAEADPATLYPIQLAQEIVQEYPEELPPLVRRQGDVLESLLATAAAGPPAANLRLLLPPGPEGEGLQAGVARLARDLKDRPPKKAGSLLAENLLLSLAKRQPGLLGPREGLD